MRLLLAARRRPHGGEEVAMPEAKTNRALLIPALVLAAMAGPIGSACSDGESTAPPPADDGGDAEASAPPAPTTTGSNDPPAFPCSTGDPYGPSTEFPQREHDLPFPSRECTKRCGDTSSATPTAGGEPRPKVSALPTGSCETDGDACRMDAVVTCAEADDQGFLYTFECTCRNGAWECAAEYEAAGGPPDCSG
jgi:hypothetical protein